MQLYINSQLHDLADANYNFGIIKTSDLNLISDNIHYNRAAQRTMGYRYYDELIRITNLTGYSKKPINNEQIMIDENNNVRINNLRFATVTGYPGWTNLNMITYATKTSVLNITGGVTGTPILTLNYLKLGKMGFVHSESWTFNITP
jgi:hypothetical protein